MGIESRRSLAALLAALVLLAGACAGTRGGDVDVRAMLREDAEQAASGGDSGLTGGDVAADGGVAADDAGIAGAAGSARAGGRGGAAGGGGATGAGGGGGAGGGRSAAASRVAGGPGATDTEIKIGFMVTANLQAAFAAIGASGQPPDEIDLQRAMVKWANDHGGVAGRKVVPVFLEVDAVGNWQAQAQQACARFTEDERVAVVVSSVVGGSDALATCLSQKNVPLVEQNHWLWDQPYWDRLGHLLYQPSRMRPDRGLPAGVATLASGGFFGSGHKLGLLRFDAPVFERLSRTVLRPALAANGANLVEEVAIGTPGGAGDFGGMSAQIGNAILRFRSRGVTHVMFLENAGIIPFFWNHEASSQEYYPRLGLMSYDLPATEASQASDRILEGSMAAGWAPSLDTVPDETPPNPARERCKQIMESQGLSTEFGLGFYLTAACDSMFFLKHALDAAPAVTAEGLRSSVEVMGGNYVSPYAFPRTQLGPRRHDGATLMALAAYDAGCDCYKYVSQPRAVP